MYYHVILVVSTHILDANGKWKGDVQLFTNAQKSKKLGSFVFGLSLYSSLEYMC